MKNMVYNMLLQSGDSKQKNKYETTNKPIRIFKRSFFLIIPRIQNQLHSQYV